MDKVILAKNVALEDGLGTTRPNDNQMIIGGTGTGKTFSTLLPSLLNMKESSFIGTFAKKSIVSKAAAFFKKRKYKTYTWNLANPENNSSIPDPFSYITTEDDTLEIARQIANCNPDYQRTTKADPYWREASECLMTGLIDLVRITEKVPTMKKVIDVFYKLKIKENGRGIVTTLDSLFDSLEKKAPNSIAAKKLRAFSQLPFATASCVRDDLEKCIQNMFPVSIQKAMSHDAYVSFEEFAEKRTAIFILTSPVRTACYAFANLMFGIAIRRLMEFAETQENNCLPRDVKLLFDDFSCGFPIQNYEKSISTFRAAGISSMMLCQSLSQLDATYGPDNSVVILDNCSSIVYFPGGMNKKTCTYISEMVNLPLDEVMFMEMGNVIVFQTGKKPIIAPRYDTLSDSHYLSFMEADKEKEPAVA